MINILHLITKIYFIYLILNGCVVHGLNLFVNDIINLKLFNDIIIRANLLFRKLFIILSRKMFVSSKDKNNNNFTSFS